MIPSLKVLLEGEGGTGKTTSLKTLADAGLEVFAIFTGDPGATAAIEDERIHYHLIPPAHVGWESLIGMAKKSNLLSTEALAKINADRSKYTQFISILNVCNDFQDQRTGKSYGDISEWNTDRVLVIDNLSGLSKMARYLIVGGRTYITLPELYNAQGNVTRMVDKLCMDLRCHFVLISHTEGERNELTGAITYLPSTPTLGKALRTTFSVNFTEVILAKRVGSKFSWSTMEANHFGLKGQNIKWVEDAPQTFVPIVEKWKESGGKIEPTEVVEK